MRAPLYFEGAVLAVLADDCVAGEQLVRVHPAAHTAKAACASAHRYAPMRASRCDPARRYLFTAFFRVRSTMNGVLTLSSA